MKVIFLDIDGVLNSTRSTFVKIGPTELPGNTDPSYGVRFGLKTVDPICVALLNKLILDTGATIVLSSTHRKFFVTEHIQFGSEMHLACLRCYLETMGVHGINKSFSITPSLHTPRGNEVQAWIDEHGELEAYIVLDDGRDFDLAQPLIWCDPAYGFDFINYAEACRALGGDVPGMILL